MSALSFSLSIRSNYHQAYFCSILFFIHNHMFKLSSSLCPLYPFLYQYVQIIIKLMSALSFSLSTHSSFYQAYISSILFFINTFKFLSSLYQLYPFLYQYIQVFIKLISALSLSLLLSSCRFGRLLQKAVSCLAARRLGSCGI